MPKKFQRHNSVRCNRVLTLAIAKPALQPVRIARFISFHDAALVLQADEVTYDQDGKELVLRGIAHLKTIGTMKGLSRG